ncbi:hypothetical protein [Hyalangium minutum]|uniref:Uncharacterized protein n=1 Tax=Hyalangium minutum TaxID=394096 RepID=A0A085WPF7_9BACT|nr:hypothetical protein [Hyalangium minutum]KFE69570.1 hypothetical protein DB31_6545 [Hyalangium minutum]
MTEPKSPPQRNWENVRAKLLDDPDTQRIARSLDMKLEDYVDLVIHYAQNPDEEPQLLVAEDEDLRAAGYNPPAPEQVAEFFLAGARGELGLGEPASYKTGYEPTPERSGKPSLRGDENQEPVATNEEARAALLKDIPKGGPDRV